MTFIYKLDPYPVKLYRRNENELPTSRLSKVIVWQTDIYIQTNRHTHMALKLYTTNAASRVVKYKPSSWAVLLNRAQRPPLPPISSSCLQVNNESWESKIRRSRRWALNTVKPDYFAAPELIQSEKNDACSRIAVEPKPSCLMQVQQ